VGRRTLRPARRRALELPARKADAPRPAGRRTRRAPEKALDGVGLDFLLLGLGPDAHIASLFPGSPQLAERERLVTSGPAGLAPYVDRVTLTLPALLSARRIVFLVTGADKADAVRRAFRDEISEDAPASLLRRGDVPIDVYLDAAASGR
jgi:6-phosphogluconolactonase/glucosamine-6-phosphate isomerase/deaminase